MLFFITTQNGLSATKTSINASILSVPFQFLHDKHTMAEIKKGIDKQELLCFPF
jgi:hypothetical protein